MGKPFPSKAEARASVAPSASRKEENIRELVQDKRVFLIVDDAKVNKQKYINVLLGSLDTSNETFLIECLPLQSSSNGNSSIILRTVDDVLRQFGTKRENFALLLILTNVVRYMFFAGKTLKKLYRTLMRFTCIAHLLHNCAVRVRAYFKNIDNVVAAIKAATMKNKNPQNDFR